MITPHVVVYGNLWHDLVNSFKGTKAAAGGGARYEQQIDDPPQTSPWASAVPNSPLPSNSYTILPMPALPCLTHSGAKELT